MNGHVDEGDKADKAKREKDAHSRRRGFKKEFRLLLILVGKYSLHVFSHKVVQCPGISKDTSCVHTFVSFFVV